MALITKQVLVCNKCGNESENVSSNVTILGEEFYFCDECLERLLNWVSRKPVTDDEAVRIAKQVIAERESTEPEQEKVKGKRFSSVNTTWDEYNLEKLLALLESGVTDSEIGKELCVSQASISSVLYRIRNSFPGQEKYKYKERVLKIHRSKSHRRKAGDE